MAKMMGYVNGQWDDFIIEWDSIVATLAVHYDSGEHGILSAGSRLWERIEQPLRAIQMAGKS